MEKTKILYGTDQITPKNTEKDHSEFEINAPKHIQTESLTSNDAAVNTGK